LGLQIWSKARVGISPNRKKEGGEKVQQQSVKGDSRASRMECTEEFA